MDWIISRQSKGLQVSQKLAMKKALSTYEEITPSEGRAESVKFKGSRGWLEKFMHRNNLSLREEHL